MPPTEPTPTDVAAVAEAIGQPTAPQQPATPPPAPTQPVAPPEVAPAEPTAPTDPFAAFAKPAEPTPLPTQPTEPAQPPATPVEPAQPVTPPTTPPVTPAPETPPAEPTYQSYDEYMNSVLEGVPKPPATPDPSTVNGDDPAAIKGFFDDLITTVKEQVRAETSKSTAIQATERRLWDDAFDKYGSLKNNKPLRDMVHSIRMGYFQRNLAITPVQAADKLLDSLGQQYKAGVADSAVVSTIENVQPQGGGTGVPVSTSLDRESVLTAVQDGGETALAAYLDGEVKAGRL